ncbi:HlyD family secretion protein [Duganella radicis]|uniref:HlyD family efflux transporter periplasmic adaptor subunit n=1 Tax=Duganella radicis TaxID=551988 RepID=A0A6L6PQS7_9BURK|nr:HlyD family efflux transporter periplasmic adaptor subunit [Duganella radicis]MTV41149.1 HlyD family efflux transporter periplasmic adaptor subunit [Duganella radicis]
MTEENLDNKANDLFRRQVMLRRQEKWRGAIHLAQPLSRPLITVASALVIIATICLLTLGTVNRKARASGVIVPTNGALPILSNGAGIVTAIRIDEGQIVRKGQTLFEIRNEHRDLRGETSVQLREQLELRRKMQLESLSLRESQFRAERASLEGRMSASRKQEVQLADEIQIAQRKYDLVEKDFQSNKALQGAGYISELQRERKEQELLDGLARKKSLERTLTQLQGEQIELSAQMASTKTRLDSDIGILKSDLASIEQQLIETDGRFGTVVSAPQDGVIGTINVQVGQSINAQKSVATLIPVSVDAMHHPEVRPPLEVQLFVSGQAIGFVEAGQKVNMRYPAFPYQLFGLQEGTVQDVSRTPLTPSELPELLAGTILSGAQVGGQPTTREALYRVRIQMKSQSVSAYGRKYYLRPGMMLEADIVQERQKIWQLFFGPALALMERSKS